MSAFRLLAYALPIPLTIAACTIDSTGTPHGQAIPFESIESDLRAALDLDDNERTGLLRALDRSLEWFAREESRAPFPINGVVHARARESVAALREIVRTADSADGLLTAVRSRFTLIEIAETPVFFTGYYTPEFDGSLVMDDRHRYPLYSVPDDLVVDPRTGETLGREVDHGVYQPYPTRAEIESNNLFRGRELVWLRDPFDAFVAHVNGTARVRLPDGSHANVNHAATNGRAYTSLGRMLIDDGVMDADSTTLQSVRAYFDEHPDLLQSYLLRNDRYVFFEFVSDEDFPRGSLRLPLEPLRSIATDKSVYPAGCAALTITEVPRADDPAQRERFVSLVVDQDSGGAIRGPARVDLYFGVGDLAGERAGRMVARGRIVYLLLK